ncbi:hypothetical protein BaRGS_00032823, partial [Batillaria attramentaria]
ATAECAPLQILQPTVWAGALICRGYRPPRALSAAPPARESARSQSHELHALNAICRQRCLAKQWTGHYRANQVASHRVQFPDRSNTTGVGINRATRCGDALELKRAIQFQQPCSFLETNGSEPLRSFQLYIYYASETGDVESACLLCRGRVVGSVSGGFYTLLPHH